MSEDEEILRDFLEEGRECLERIELGLVALEAMPADEQLIAQVYRGLHKIKGTSSLMGYRELEMLTHRGEDVLEALRARRITMTPVVTSSLLALADELRLRLDTVEREGDDVAPAELALLAALAAHAQGDAGDFTLRPAAVHQPGAVTPAPDPVPADPEPAEAAAAEPEPVQSATAEPEPAMAEPATAEPEPVPVAARAADPAPAAEPSAAAVAGPAPGPDPAIRVDAATLDTLMSLAGELVLLRGRLAELTANESGGELVDTYRHLRRATDDLLGTVRHARLQPIGTILRRYPRVARDLGLELGKQLTVTVRGEEVGVDRAINEALAEALLHLIRNAVDHGLEEPAERAAVGKPAAGTLTITASQEGGRVCVEVADDGRGIDIGAVIERALAAGAIAHEDVASMSDRDRRQLIFLPGLSTRSQASAVSGRGVGMDAVRLDLARVGGTIEVLSAPGRGTTFRIDVPLTLSIVACLLVSAGGRRYCVPQTAIREIVALGDRELAEVGGAPLLRGRGELVPLIELAAALRTPADAGGEAERSVVIVESEHDRFGLIVEAVGNPIEAVVKPLPPSIRSARVFSGVSVLADGSPTLILDLDALATHAGLLGVASPPPAEAAPPAAAETVELLLARAQGGRLLAVPAARVRRLELADALRLRHASGRDLLDEGPELLPLVRLDGGPAGSDATPPAGELDVIVCDTPAGEIGFVVDAIEDIVHGEIVTMDQPGAIGLARLPDDRGVADLLDVCAWRAPEAVAP